MSAEFVTLLAMIAMAFPYMLNLDHTWRYQRPSGLASLHWRMWTWCFFLLSIYFNFHPHAMHKHGHHLVTDVVKFPTVLKYGLPLITVIVFSCRIYDLWLEKMPIGAASKVKAFNLLKWLALPGLVALILTICAQLLLVSDFRRSLILYFLGTLGAIGAFLYAITCFLQVTRSEKSVSGSSVLLHHLPFLVQLLGYLALCLVLVLNYVNVDWFAVGQFGIMFIGNLGFVLSRFFAKKRGYNAMDAADAAADAEEFEV